jgi:methylated-DNA-protein-cysteine methyltransferase-like protein
VGHLLADVLGHAHGGVPWQRVINASGRSSLPAASGERQRALLQAEGVEFRASGAVVASAWWDRAEPFFA